jgi:tetratricopeptide (TPR) repeat protein
VFVGRAVARDRVDHLLASAPPYPVVCFYGPPRIGKSALLERVAREQLDLRREAVLVDLADATSPAQIGEQIRRGLTRRRPWRLFTRFATVRDELARMRPTDAPGALVQSAGDAAKIVVGIAGQAHPASTALGGVLLAARTLRGPLRAVLRPRQRRWARREMRALPSRRATFPRERTVRLQGLDQLVPRALAEDFAERRRRRARSVVLLFDHHDRGRVPLLAASGEDFALALARELQRKEVRVLVVVARDAPLDRLGDDADGRDGAMQDDAGVWRSQNVEQQGLGLLSEDEMTELLRLRPNVEGRETELGELCGGHPGVLDLAIAASRTRPPPGGLSTNHDAAARAILDHVTTCFLEGLSPEQRREMRLAAVPRAFDRALLNVVLDRETEQGWIDEQLGRGLLEPVVDARHGDGVWRVISALRRVLLRELATGVDRHMFLAAQSRALGHLATLPRAADDEAEFVREVEREYHRAAMDPDEGLNELGRRADVALAEHRIDRCQRILDALEDLTIIDRRTDVGVALVRAKLLNDLHAYELAAKELERAARRYPLDAQLDPAAVALALELAKTARLRGEYDDALRRFDELERLAARVQAHPLNVHCPWERSLVRRQLDDIGEASAELSIARDRFSALVARDPDRAERDARRYGISQLLRKPAHMLRHEAELHRMAGDYAAAHSCIEQALELYGNADVSATLYARVVRANILRAEGLDTEAEAEARGVRERCESALPVEERARLLALRAEALAAIACGREPYAALDALVQTPLELYPAAAPTGLLARGELRRRQHDYAGAINDYKGAYELDVELGSQVKACTALIGIAEAKRALGSRDQERLDAVLQFDCLVDVPWLRVRAQLLRAVLRREEAGDALREAERAVRSFRRRRRDVRVDDALLQRVTDQIVLGGPVAPIRLEIL